MRLKDGGALGLGIASLVTGLAAAALIALIHLVIWQAVVSDAPRLPGVPLADHPDRLREYWPLVLCLLIAACAVAGFLRPHVAWGVALIVLGLAALAVEFGGLLVGTMLAVWSGILMIGAARVQADAGQEERIRGRGDRARDRG